MTSINKQNSQNYLNEKVQHWVPLISSIDSANMKFSTDDNVDRFGDPNEKKKLVRVLTVVAYIFSVSLAAILLSLYYIMFWKPKYKNLTHIDEIGRLCHSTQYQRELRQQIMQNGSSVRL